jgi:pyruvate dehydrogenase E2 component (dihydrolipoamide acetyltransferase)
MPVEITMPRLSDTMEQGTVVSWQVKEGDTVSSGDVIADIETDKATMELQTFDDGVVARLVAAEGEQVAVGTVIAVLAGKGEDAAEVGKSAGAGKKESKAEQAGAKAPAQAAAAKDGGDESRPADRGGATAVAEETNGKAQANGARSGADAGGETGDDADDEDPGHRGGRLFASPHARKGAAGTGVNLSGVQGSGPSGRIVRKDVEAAARGGSRAATGGGGGAPRVTMPAVGAALEDKTVTLSNMRATIARRLVESKATIPHYQVTVSARLDALLALREQLNDQLESQGVKLSVNDFLVRACAVAMHQHPFVNASWVDKGPALRLHGRVNIGVAIALPEERGGGLVVATLRDSDRIGLREISSETKRLATKAREKGLTIEEMADSTFTISNMGMFGVDHFTAIINPPNAAILAVGRAIERPFIEYGEDGEPELVVGHEMAMTMSSDHRIVDGAMAAAYLNTVRELLENPAALLV